MYHVFTDNKDEYVKTKREALKIIKTWEGEGYENLRIHKEYNESDEFDCILAIGNFPF